ncbi:MAG: hypothetical protein KBS41_05145 [Oscillospiraceae bacterium]|nr:hypothetical protein [Candidatus Equicaccousia limihippi]
MRKKLLALLLTVAVLAATIVPTLVVPSVATGANLWANGDMDGLGFDDVNSTQANAAGWYGSGIAGNGLAQVFDLEHGEHNNN